MNPGSPSAWSVFQRRCGWSSHPVALARSEPLWIAMQLGGSGPKAGRAVAGEAGTGGGPGQGSASGARHFLCSTAERWQQAPGSCDEQRVRRAGVRDLNRASLPAIAASTRMGLVGGRLR